MINFLQCIKTTCIVAAVLIFSTGLGQEQDTTASDTLTGEKAELMIGDIAPSWALMIGPGEFEFLKNWTVEKGEKLRKSKTQPYRHAVVLSFFATWCVPCMKELPHLQNLYEKYSEERVKFFLVDITEATRSNPGNEDVPQANPFLKKKGITVPLLTDTRGVAMERYGASSLPRLFIIDQYRTLRMLKKGFEENKDFESEVSKMIDILLKEISENEKKSE